MPIILCHNGQPRVHRRIMGLALAIAGLVSPGGAAPASSDRGSMDLVRRMMAVYHSATSLQETSTAHIFVGTADFYQSATTRYARPNLVVMDTQDPNNGTLQVRCDGRTVTVYSGKQNIYTRRTAPPTLADVLNVASRETEDLTGSPISQILSPIEFAVGGPTPSEARSFGTSGQATIAGRRAVAVISPADPAWLRGFVARSIISATERGRPIITPAPSAITLWIDPASHTMLKASARLAWRLGIAGHTARLMRMAFDETHTDVHMNARLSPDSFRFQPPAGAKELFQERR